MAQSGRAWKPSMRQNGEKAIKVFAERSVPRDTNYVQERKPLQKSIGKGCRSNKWTNRSQAWWADNYYESICNFGVDDGGASLVRVTST